MIFNQPHGRYLLVSKLATSGMADVFLARSPEDDLDDLVALKCLHPHLARDREVLRQFYEEARLGRLFRSPNLITVHDARAMGGRHTIVMDFAAGVTASMFNERCRERGAKPSNINVLEICRQAAVGLHDAHETVDAAGQTLDVVHRDVSLDNLLVGYDGRVRLLDFGLARLGDDATRLENAGKTPYLAPELVRGDEYDRRVDIYALGIVLYELLSGSSPFRMHSQAQALSSIVEGVTTPPLEGPRFAEVNALTMRAIALDPDDRFQTAHQMRLAIEELLNARPAKPQLRQHVGELFAEERYELEQQSEKARKAPRPSLRTVDLSSAPNTEIETQPYERFEVGEAGIETVIRHLDRGDTNVSERGELIAERKSPSLSRGLRILLVLVILLAGAGVAALLAEARGVELFGILSSQTVLVETTPPGATISLDGEPLEGQTPARVTFSPNTGASLVATLPGYETASVRLDHMTPQEIQLDLAVDSAAVDAPIGSVRINYTPATATLQIDGEAFEGGSPIYVDGLSLGREHTVRLELEGYEPLVFPFTLDSVDTLELELNLTEQGPLGELTIRSTPASAKVEINGQEVGTTPFGPIELPAGQSYAVSISLNGYEEWRRGIYLRESGETVSVDLTGTD